MVPERGRPLRILLTGPPGCGKTTAVRKIVHALDGTPMAGFYTEEIRESGRRQGFRWHRLDGYSGTLAHVDIKSRYRVSKYGVDIEGFEREVVSALDPTTTDARLFVIDEIGKMECFSRQFAEAVHRLLEANVSVLATVALKGGGLIREVKTHPEVTLLHLTAENRNQTAEQVAETLKSALT